MVSSEAVSRLFIKHQHMLMDYIIGMVHNVNDAEDIFQEVGVTILSKSEPPQDDAAFASWCRGIARNMLLHYWRTKRRSRVVMDARLMEIVDLAYQEAEEVADHWREKRRALSSCLQDLPRESQDILNWRYGQNLSSRDLGARIGRTPEAVRKWISRIKKGLFDCIERRLVMGTTR